jgi:peptidyl-dipeptidase Dcp
MAGAKPNAFAGVCLAPKGDRPSARATAPYVDEAATLGFPAMTRPLLAPWPGPFGGVPPFDKVTLEDFTPALEEAMAEQLAAVETIANTQGPATIANTLAALERSGRALERVYTVYGVWSSTLSTPAFQAVELALAPKLAAFQDRISQHDGLFRRIAAVYEARDTLCKTDEEKRLAWLTYTSFVRAGAKLGTEAKARVAAINERLATLYTTFTQAILGDEEEQFLLIEKEEDLEGLPASFRASAAEAASAKGNPGAWAVANTRSVVEPFLAHSARRGLREAVWRTFVSRGEHEGARDTRPTIAEILRLRAERAGLLGYATHAHWRIEDSMAKTPERALALMEAVWPAAVARVKEEVADMQALASAPIEPWDYRYYAEKVRQARYDLDENEVKPYLSLERLREGMFWVASRLFDLHFEAVLGIPVCHPDVRVWEVKRGDGRHVGLYYFDPFARAGKQSGAWMNAYRSQERFDGEVTTIVSNNANFTKPAPGEPVLVSWDDATTLFHEFGHALHGLCANATYPTLSGTNVPRDYVEFPSQLLERWLSTAEVLGRFALHATTGAPMPAALLEKLERAARFNQGFATVEYLSAALVDLKAHLAGSTPVDATTFERDTLVALGMPKEVVMRHRMPQFSHVFSGDGYSAGYYSYLWADTLSTDAFEAFSEAKGPYDVDVARRLHEHVFSAGNTIDPATSYRAFRGRDPGIAALMRKRGFPVPDGVS